MTVSVLPVEPLEGAPAKLAAELVGVLPDPITLAGVGGRDPRLPCRLGNLKTD
jgi:hypothetical protein